MKTTIILTTIEPLANNLTASYVIGAIIAVLIFGYLLYSLIKPEKF